MLTKIVYNCDSESLGDVSQEDFVDAFENEVGVPPQFRNADVHVTFNCGASGLVTVESDDADADAARWDEFCETFREMAEKAFRHCCEA